MKKFILPLVLFILSCAIAFAEQPHWPTQNGEPLQCNFGFKRVATPTINLDSDDTIIVSDYLPSGTNGFELRAASGSFIINHPDNIATGAARIGRLVSQGESFIWNGLAGTFTGVIQTDNASTVIRIDGAWGQYEK